MAGGSPPPAYFRKEKMAKIVGFKRTPSGLRVAHGEYFLALSALEYWWAYGSDGLVQRVAPSRTHKDVSFALRITDVAALEQWQSEKERSK